MAAVHCTRMTISIADELVPTLDEIARLYNGKRSKAVAALLRGEVSVRNGDVTKHRRVSSAKTTKASLT